MNSFPLRFENPCLFNISNAVYKVKDQVEKLIFKCKHLTQNWATNLKQQTSDEFIDLSGNQA